MKDVENDFLGFKEAISLAVVLVKPNFNKEFIIYTNLIEEAIYVVLLQKSNQNNEQHVAYMSQILSDDEINYSFIEKHMYALVKAIDKFYDFILGKHTKVKVPILTINFFLSQTLIYGKLAHCLAKIEEHNLMITNFNTIERSDLALHLAQHPEPSDFVENDENALLTIFFIENQNLDLVENPWYKDIIHYLQYQKCPNYLESHQKRRLRLETSKYHILGNCLFSRFTDGLLL